MEKLRFDAEVLSLKGSDTSLPVPGFCMNAGKTWKTQNRGCPLLVSCREAARLPLRVASHLAWGGGTHV